MLLKLGVSIARLIRQCRRALSIVEDVFRLLDDEPVVTSTFESNHSPGSLHYCNAAFDLRLPAGRVDIITDRLKKALSPDFDVVQHGDHLHIEYDPKT